MRKVRLKYFLLILTVIFIFPGCSGISSKSESGTTIPSTVDLSMRAKVGDSNVVNLTWESNSIKSEDIKTFAILRTTCTTYDFLIDRIYYPVTKFTPEKGFDGKSFTDSNTADNTEYQYAAEISLKDGKLIYSRPLKVKTKNKKLPVLTNPEIFVDKINYFIEIRDNGAPLKRYPFSMGRKPENRKLHQDSASTPEGVYIIYQLQPEATYYKAYDIDYPNEIDKIRYNFAVKEGLISKKWEKPPGIGGEIQIHGGHITNNWTAGCISIRNNDIDELFAQKAIKAGTIVTIVGPELTIEDIKCIEEYKGSEKVELIQQKLKDAGYYKGNIDGKINEDICIAIGRFQIKSKLPATCQPDRKTVETLLK